MLQAIDDALKSAVEAEKKTSNGADKAFKNAVKMLTDYGRNYHPKEAVTERMEKAEGEDRSSLKVLNRLKETFQVREEQTRFLRRTVVLILLQPLEKESTTEVEFLLYKSLPDKNPTVVTRKHRLIDTTQSLILCQRYSAKPQKCRKSFGILAVTQATSVSRSNRILTFIRTFRADSEMTSKAIQLSNLSMSPGIPRGILWTGTGSSPSPRSLFSLIGRAGYILNQDRVLGLLATSGALKKPSFSKVSPSLSQLLRLLTSCRCLRKARG